MFLDEELRVGTQLITVHYGAITYHYSERYGVFDGQVQELSDAGLNEIMSAPTIYQYGDASFVDGSIKVEGVRSGDSYHGMQADMGLKCGRIEG